MPHPPLARVHPLLEDRLRVARQVPLPRLRLTKARHQLRTPFASLVACPQQCPPGVPQET